MPVPALPIELQLYIIKLATPLHEMTRRRETLKSCSLVHRSWTPTAQELLFQHLEHALKIKPYWRPTDESIEIIEVKDGDLVEEDDDRLERSLREAPGSGNEPQRSFGALTLEILRNLSAGRNATLTSLAPTISSLCVYLLVSPVDGQGLDKLSPYFSNLKHLLCVGCSSKTCRYSDNNNRAPSFTKLKTLALVDVTADFGWQGSSVNSQVWSSLTCLVLKNAALFLGPNSLAAWTPNLDTFVSHCSAPRLDVVLENLPGSTLRRAVLITALQDIPFLPAVRLSSSLEVLHVFALVDPNQDGSVALFDEEAINGIQNHLIACARGSPNLMVKVEMVLTSVKTADKLFEEIADRYSLLR